MFSYKRTETLQACSHERDHSENHRSRIASTPESTHEHAGAAESIRVFLVRDDVRVRMRALRRSHGLASAYQAVSSWTLIILAWTAVVWLVPLWLAPLALLVIGSRQRALNNVLHDAAHGNAFRSVRINRWFAQALAAIPQAEDFEAYRDRHRRHHAHLGDPARDPDFLSAPTPAPTSRGFRSVRFYAHFACDLRAWWSSVSGAWPALSWRQRLRAAGWWVGVALLLGVIVGWLPALSFLGLWVAARATTYHLIRTFAEISDHTGLRPGPVCRYTRNMPSGSVSMVLHPFHDNYHMAHHVVPSIPMSQLKRLHQLLLECDEYRDAQAIDRYFRGPRSVVCSWVANEVGSAR